MKGLNFEKQYVQILNECMEVGVESTDRTGIGTIRDPGKNITIDYSVDGFPIIQGKKVNGLNAIVEAIWMLNGFTNTDFLKKHHVNYWDSWADSNGDLGPVYGAQIRNFNGVDQLVKTCRLLLDKPDTRRAVISLWNVNELNLMKLEPCHCMYQFLIIDNKLEMCVTQRSGDLFIGIPYDFILFSTIHIFVAKLLNIEPTKIHYTINDAHIYKNHFNQVEEYLNNFLSDEKKIIDKYKPLNINDLFDFDCSEFILSTDLEGPTNDSHKIKGLLNLFESKLTTLDINILNRYKSYPFIKAPVAI